MRGFMSLAVICIAAAAVNAFPQTQSVDPAYLRQYYAHLAQANREGAVEAAPIYENSNQEAAPQYQQQRHDQARAQQAQQGYVAPQIRQYSPAPPQQVQYVQQPQQSYKQPTAGPKQVRRPYDGQNLKDEEEDYDINASYQFGFDVKDDEFTNYQNRKEVRDGGVIKGSYSVVDSDGFIRTVTYTADPKEGFKAEVVREPTDIKVKIPQPQQPSNELRHQNHQYPTAGYKQVPQQQKQQPQQYQYE